MDSASQSSNAQARGRRLELRVAKTSHFVVAPLFTIISAAGLAGAQTTTGYRQFNRLCRFICLGARQSSLLENPWGTAFLPVQDFFFDEGSAGWLDSYDDTGQLISGFNIPLPVTGTVAFADRTHDSDQG